MRRSYGTLAVVLCLLVMACSGSQRSTSQRADASLITTAELDASGHADAYTAVQSLRPAWLRVRGSTSLAGREIVKVYLDGSLMGDTNHLRQIATHSISTLRYLNGLEATQRWGLDHGAGAIVISTRGRQPRGQEGAGGS
ncbi:MAG: hypothetical protein KFH98_11340 [Gemmatimonadetes bacterium]|nr:hypothetical protein [Gemmatimonadota bacterium]